MDNKVLRKILNDINDDDLKTMFETSIVSSIISKPDVEEKVEKYLEYYIPVSLGDIIEYQGNEYCVTCVYVDNSADICGKDSTKKNVGFYMKDVKVVGRLQVIKEGK